MPYPRRSRPQTQDTFLYTKNGPECYRRHNPKQCILGIDLENFCVIMLDLDKFKQVNNTHGYQTGDEELMQCAKLIRTNIRFEDVCRYGGEEFVVLVDGNLQAGEKPANACGKPWKIICLSDGQERFIIL